MTENVYRKLAQRLDAMPNSFPATESGSDLRLLAKMFTPQEAALGAVMRMTPEPAADIAARIDMDPKEAAQKVAELSQYQLSIPAQSVFDAADHTARIMKELA